MNLGRIACCALTLALLLGTARAAEHPWMKPDLLAAAQKEGSFTIYSDINEAEEQPLLKIFQDATGIRPDYIRGSDSEILSRIAIEARAGKHAWDVVELTLMDSLPKQLVMDYTPAQAAALMPGAQGPGRLGNGTYAIFHTPAYNTDKVKAADLPKSYEDFLKHPEWAGHVAIDSTDRDWLKGLFETYGEEKGRALMSGIVKTLHPALVKGHLALARAVGSGEYWIALNNYVNLTLNVKLSGAPTDFWVLEPVVTTYGNTAASANAPHPNAAKLAVEFLLSAEAQKQRTNAGRIPTRPDVATNPPGVLDQFKDKKLVGVALPPEESARWQKTFDQFFKDQ